MNCMLAFYQIDRLLGTRVNSLSLTDVSHCELAEIPNSKRTHITPVIHPSSYIRLADEPVGKHISLEHLELMPAVQHLLKVPIPEHFILSNPCSAPTSPSRSIKPSRITCYVHFPNTFLLDLWRFKIVTTQSVFFTAKKLL